MSTRSRLRAHRSKIGHQPAKTAALVDSETQAGATGFVEEMDRDENVLIMGEDIGAYGGAWMPVAFTIAGSLLGEED